MSTLPLKLKNTRWNEITKHTRKNEIFTIRDLSSSYFPKIFKFSRKRKAGLGSVIVSSLSGSFKEFLNQRIRQLLRW